jgi:hypothetical protein
MRTKRVAKPRGRRDGYINLRASEDEREAFAKVAEAKGVRHPYTLLRTMSLNEVLAERDRLAAIFKEPSA